MTRGIPLPCMEQARTTTGLKSEVSDDARGFIDNGLLAKFSSNILGVRWRALFHVCSQISEEVEDHGCRIR